MSECNNCDKYDYKTHSCPIFCDVIKNTIEDVRAGERKAIFDELYFRLLNDDDEATIEWCQSNLIDDVDDYIEKGGAKVTCIDCVRYGDLHSSCALARDMKLDEDSPICERFKGKEQNK